MDIRKVRRNILVWIMIFCFVFAYRYVNGIFLKNFRVFGDIVTNRYKTGSKANNNTKVLSYNN